MDLSLPTIDQPNLSDRVYEILRGSILSKRFAPGERLDLPAIGEKLGISRTPLKEALLRLEIEGMVKIIPRSGTYVTDLDPQDIADSFDLRRVLENYAIERAVDRLSDGDVDELARMVERLGELASAEDRDAIYPDYLQLDHRFHRRIVLLAGNERLQKAHARENVHAQMGRVRYRDSERELDIAQNEHERIIAALAARDKEEAKAVMDTHLRRAKRSLMKDMDHSDEQA
jgi:DNA-binding GntR family transcriptional regulator